MTDRYVAFIRHGAYHQRPGVPSALQPYPLTEEGLQQATACGVEIADVMRKNGWSLNPQAHSSLQLRAWQTATTALGAMGEVGQAATLTQVADLSERSVGSAANLTLDEIENALRDDPRVDAPPTGWKSNSDYRLPLHGAESLMDAGTRVARYVQAAIEVEPTASGSDLTLFFGHGASFRHAAFKLGLLEREQISALSMFHAKPLLFRYSAQGTWSYYGGDWKHRKRSEDEVD